MEHPGGTVAVLDVGGVDHGDQQEANGIDQDVTFPALDLLGRVIARNAAAFRGFHRLTVDHRGRGNGLAPLLLARLDGQGMVDAATGAVLTPGPDVAVHRAAGRKFLGQHAPLAAGREQIEKRVDNLAQDRRSGPTDRLRRRQMGCDQGLLPVRRVAYVACALPLILIAGRFSPHLVSPVVAATTTESQVTETTQLVLGQALSLQI